MLGLTKVRHLHRCWVIWDVPVLGLVVVGLLSLRTGAELVPKIFNTFNNYPKRRKKEKIDSR